MTMFTYTTNIPFATNNPSNDQPIMQVNTNSISSLIAVDHVGFNSTGSGAPNGSGGHHLQVSFDSKNTPGALTDPVSVLYTGSGTASTVSQLFFKNQNATFPISPIAAFGSYPGASSNMAVTALNQFNVTTVTRIGTGQYTVSLSANVVANSNFAVLATCTNLNLASSVANLNIGYQITGTGTFTLFINAPSNIAQDPQQFSFFVLQI